MITDRKRMDRIVKDLNKLADTCRRAGIANIALNNKVVRHILYVAEGAEHPATTADNIMQK